MVLALSCNSRLAEWVVDTRALLVAWRARSTWKETEGAQRILRYLMFADRFLFVRPRYAASGRRSDFDRLAEA